MQPASPQAQGVFSKTPFSNLLVYAMERRLSGTMELRAPDERAVSVLFIDGVPAKARLSEGALFLGEILVELGYVTEEQHQVVLAQNQVSGDLYGRALLAQGALSEEQLHEGLATQLSRKIEYVFTLPTDTTFAYYDGYNALEAFGAEDYPIIDPLVTMWAGIRASPPWEHIHQTLTRIGTAAVRVAAHADTERFGFGKAERAALDLLRQRPHRVVELSQAKVIGPTGAQLLVYCLLITKQVELIEMPPSKRPAAPSTAPPSVRPGMPPRPAGVLPQPGSVAPSSPAPAAPAAFGAAQSASQNSGIGPRPSSQTSPSSPGGAASAPNLTGTNPPAIAKVQLKQSSVSQPAKTGVISEQIATSPRDNRIASPLPQPIPLTAGASSTMGSMGSAADQRSGLGGPAGPQPARAPAGQVGQVTQTGQASASQPRPAPHANLGTSAAPPSSRHMQAASVTSSGTTDGPPSSQRAPTSQRTFAPTPGMPLNTQTAPPPAPSAGRIQVPAGSTGKLPAATPSSSNIAAAVPPHKKAEYDALRAKVIARAESISSQDFFEMLGVSQTAKPEEIQKAYLIAAKEWHPDRLPAALADVKDACSKVFAHISEANKTLTDPKRHKEYMTLIKDGGATPDDQAKIQAILEATTNFSKAEFYLKKNNLAEAEAMCRKAYEADPGQADYLAMLAWLEAQKVQDKDQTRVRIAMLDKALKMNANCERAYFYRGMLHKRMDNTVAAVKDFKAASDLNPRNLDALREVRLYQMRKGQPASSGSGGNSPSGAPGRPSTPPKANPKGGDTGGGLFGKLFKK